MTENRLHPPQFTRRTVSGFVLAAAGFIVLGLILSGTSKSAISEDDPPASAGDRDAAGAGSVARELPMEIGESFDRDALPLFRTYCNVCHSTQEQKGELDLERFADLAEVRKHPKVFQKVAEMLDNGEMPPKDAPQPKADERKQLQTWVHEYLHAEALAHAGDPGPVMLRRLSLVEYRNSIRDLTGVDLDPAREFPADGAAGEGFTNAADALVMSPALLSKYLDAGKKIASHAVLLQDGFRFSRSSMARDWTDEIIAKIRGYYAKYADAEGRIPLDKYFAALMNQRDELRSGKLTLNDLARQQGLSAHYLRQLWSLIEDDQSHGRYLDRFRVQLSQGVGAEAPALVAQVQQLQSLLWRTNPVGHFKSRQLPVIGLQDGQSLRLKLPPAAADATRITISLLINDAGDGSENDVAVLKNARLELPEREAIPLAALGEVSERLARRRESALGATSEYLRIVSGVTKLPSRDEVLKLAEDSRLDPAVLAGWLDYLGVGSESKPTVVGHLTDLIPEANGYQAIKGWGRSETPLIVANRSDEELRIPGIMPPHRVAIHPSPTTAIAVAWQAPLELTAHIEAFVKDAHPECGNGQSWRLERRRLRGTDVLASGVIDRGAKAEIPGFANVRIGQGEIVSLVVGPRDGDHSCDMTEVDLTIKDEGDANRVWNLSTDVSSDIESGNPHADRQGNQGVWHFYTLPINAEKKKRDAIPLGSLLDEWRLTQDAAARERLAEQIQNLVVSPSNSAVAAENLELIRQMKSLAGPLYRHDGEYPLGPVQPNSNTKEDGNPPGNHEPFGLPRALFGKRPDGSPVEESHLIVQGPTALSFDLPADLAAGGEFACDVSLDAVAGSKGSIQVELVVGRQETASTFDLTRPVISLPGTETRLKITAELDAFREMFPLFVCYPQVIPVDEVVTISLFHRDDDYLDRLMLNDEERADLDRLWDELRYVSQDAIRIQQAFDQFIGFASQENRVEEFEPLRKPINERAAAMEQLLQDSEAIHLDKLSDFAARAYRHPLTTEQHAAIRDMYAELRGLDLSHEEAFRLTLARVLIAADFLYKLEAIPKGQQAYPVSDRELATRLSFFLWSSLPDESLTRLADQGGLSDPENLVAEMRRMLRDARVRAMATEFACQWINVRDFDQLDEKSERHFPTFGTLKQDMYEESIQFFVDLFQRDGSLLEVLDSDHTFLNENLARHYGIAGVTGADFRRVDSIKGSGRGGILAMATTLAKQSGASRTSPILRGNWILESLLGEKLPKPPKDVPKLPEDEADTEGLSVRQLVEKHRALPQCATCHDRIDPFGMALEGFDAIGGTRSVDLGNRPIDTQVALKDGTTFDGLPGLRDYLLNQRRGEFVRTFCRKLLGYALGRGVQLSDEPLLDEMIMALEKNNYRVAAAIEVVVRSRQFRYIRGSDFLGIE